jgi:hypothetical protein
MRTLTEILDYTRSMLDESSAIFWTDAELTRYINFEYKALVSEIHATHSGRYETSVTVNTIANNRFASIASNNSGVVLGVLDTGLDRILEPVDRRLFMANSGVTIVGRPSQFDVVGNSLWLYPCPDAVYPLEVRYIYFPADLASAGDQVDFPLGYEDVIALGVVRKALMKDKQDITEISGDYKSRKRRMLVSLQIRQAFRPRRVSSM